MNDLECLALPRLQWPLLDKFYRTHGSPMRIARHGQPWVARNPAIAAALCLSPVEQGYWLTGLFVAPSQRRGGVATTLLQQSLASTPGPVWLFCPAQLNAFYGRLEFTPCEVLPESLAGRLARYSRSKALVALCRAVAA